MAVQTTKIDTVVKLITRKSGATIGQIEKATNWQPHTVRAALSRLRKRGMTVLLTQTAKDGKVYKATVA
jgi:Mn-dependent DtxR family transcriptional regulator